MCKKEVWLGWAFARQSIGDGLERIVSLVLAFGRPYLFLLIWWCALSSYSGPIFMVKTRFVVFHVQNIPTACMNGT